MTDVHCCNFKRYETCFLLVLVLCRYFVLKQGKIFWFKSDVVTPVSALVEQRKSLQSVQCKC